MNNWKYAKFRTYVENSLRNDDHSNMWPLNVYDTLVDLGGSAEEIFAIFLVLGLNT